VTAINKLINFLLKRMKALFQHSLIHTVDEMGVNYRVETTWGQCLRITCCGKNDYTTHLIVYFLAFY